MLNMHPNLQMIKNDVKRALDEDIGTGDVSAALISLSCRASAEVVTREPLLVCGIPWFNEVMREIDPSLIIDWNVADGQWIPEPGVLCRINGTARSLLTAERTALNFLQTLSATATKSYRFHLQLEGLGTRLLDTRKTIPGLRYAQKYAVTCGGGQNHRMGLYDAILIKENHIAASYSIKAAIETSRHIHPDLFVEVEVETLKQLREALDAKPDRILLDNFTLEQLREAVTINQPKQCDLEASGGISIDNIRTIALTGVDFISVGSLTKSIEAIDLSLLIKEIA
jgi:nicotinate-nucleotide pyrophosphorylase (carboxylating)